MSDAPADPPTMPVQAVGRADTSTTPVAAPRAGGARHRAGGGRDERPDHRADRASGSDERDGSGGSSDPGTDAEPPTPTLLEQMGGVSGIVSSGVPVVVFVAAQAIFSSLTVSIVAAVVSALLIAGWRLVRGEPIQPALSGLLGVAVCAFIAHRTGQAKGFFLLGIWTSLLYGGVFLCSVLVRWPLVGVIWHLVNGQGQGWRSSPALRRAFDLASLAWTVVFAARFVVQHWLYNQADADDVLGWVRLAMGIPLAALAALVTVWAIRRSQVEHAREAPA